MRIFAITFALVIVLCNCAFSDIIYFKDGGKVEGIIKEKAGDHITIDIGIGTMSVRMDEIDHIEAAEPQEIERLKKKKRSYEIERGEWAPAGYEDISITYLRANDDRNALREARRESQSIKDEVYQKEKRLSELLNTLDEKGQELKEIDPEKNVKRYNEVITEINSINADVNKENNKIKDLYEREKKLNTNLAKLTKGYRGSYQLFKVTWSKRRDDIDEAEITADELYFSEEMDKRTGDMESDFKKDVASYTPEGDHVIVDALIDDSVSARLMVDTGASIVLVYTDVAHRLGLTYQDIHTDIEIVTADGRSVQAKPVILKSVKVGNAEVKNVQAAILERDVAGSVDGLLGMSFLSHFVIKVDSVDKKLILERVL